MLVCILCVLLLFISSLLTLAFAFFLFFFFNDTATTEIYTLSLHDALPISPRGAGWCGAGRGVRGVGCRDARRTRSEEHTSELQSRQYLVCRLLLEKKKKKTEKHKDTDT